MSVAPPARGARRDWSELPGHILEALESGLGARVTAAESQPGGFSPGIAARVTLGDGRRAFVKAVAHEPNPTSPQFHRQEARIVGAIPDHAPVPRLLWSLDEGEEGWVVLALQDIEGAEPNQPWVPSELDRVLEASGELYAALTPSPIEAPLAAERLSSSINSWHLLLDEAPAGLDEWSARHLAELVTLEALVADAVAGDTLVHFDLRADNILLTSDQVYFVDWPHAAVGAAWLDCVAFAPSVAMQGGTEPEELLRRWPTGAEADSDAVTTAVACVAGFFTQRSLLPAPPGLPTLRSFQAAQGAIARRWLAQRTGWR